jgi:N-acetylglutamate synthase-like GNAT family acetyltransferase
MLSRIQSTIRMQAEAGREVEHVGPFVATFTPGIDNPFLNYAIPEEGAEASAGDVAALVDAFRRRGLRPRLEYVAELAPAVEPALRAAGFEEELRTPLMIVKNAAAIAPPDGFELLAPATDEQFEEAGAVQNDAYGENPIPLERAARSLRRTVEGGGVVVLARERATGTGVGAGVVVAPSGGASELTSVGVRERFRRRGIAAAIASWLARRAHEHGIALVFLMAHGEDEARIYARAGFVRVGEVLHISQA